eukprot:439808-Prorocentrum_lima.AAC.1
MVVEAAPGSSAVAAAADPSAPAAADPMEVEPARGAKRTAEGPIDDPWLPPPSTQEEFLAFA